MQIALLLPSAALIGWLMGAWADSKLHTSWLGLVGIVFGGVSGLVYVVRMVLSTKPGSNNGGGEKADSKKEDPERYPMTEASHPIVGLTDEALQTMLKRAMLITLGIGLVSSIVLLIASGWRNAAMLCRGRSDLRCQHYGVAAADTAD